MDLARLRGMITDKSATFHFHEDLARMSPGDQKRRVAELLEFAASIKVPTVIDAEPEEEESEVERSTIWTWPDILKKAGIGNHIRIDMEPDRHRAGLTVWFVIPLVVPLVGWFVRDTTCCYHLWAHKAERILILAPKNVCGSVADRASGEFREITRAARRCCARGYLGNLSDGQAPVGRRRCRPTSSLARRR